MENSFCIFIISHGRPGNIKTINLLESSGYSGKIIIVIDDEDKYQQEYINNFPGLIEIFCKNDYFQICDSGDARYDKISTIYARTACFDIAKKNEIDYFLVLDDDYSAFYFTLDSNREYATKNMAIKNMDKVINYHLDFFKKTNATSICFAQSGDFIGGKGAGILKYGSLRKCMNSFFHKTANKIIYFSRMNEDVVTSSVLGSRGKLFLTLPFVKLSQTQTQKDKGGMTSLYVETGTFVKSFYSVMYAPSFSKISRIGAMNRIHHKIKWNNAVPKIIEQRFKKNNDQDTL